MIRATLRMDALSRTAAGGGHLAEHVVQVPARRQAAQALRRIVGENPAAGDDHGARAHGIDLLEDMRGDHDRLLGRHLPDQLRSEEHTSELQSLMRNSYAVFCLKKK